MRLLTTYEVTFPTSRGDPYRPEAVPTYTLYPARLVRVTGLQVRDAIVFVLVVGVGVEEPGVVDEPEVVAGATLTITGNDALPSIPTVIVTVAEYVPAANPAEFTATAAAAVLVIGPTSGDTVSQVALSFAIKKDGYLVDTATLTIWLGGLVAP